MSKEKFGQDNKMIDIGLKFRNPKSEIRNRNQGFTMMELMLTIGILAVALTMVSGLFPVAVRENNESYKDIVGTLICENGLAVAKTMIEKSDISTSTLEIVVDEDDDDGGSNDHTGIISLKSQHYQEFVDADYNNGTINDDDDNPYKIQGFGVLGRKTSISSSSPYQLVIVSYHRRKDHKALFETIEIDSDIAAKAKSFTITDGDISENDRVKLIGSPVIAKDTGLFSKIIAVSGSTVQLERSFGEKINSSTDFFVLVEKNGANQIQTKSPALSVLVTITGLE